MKVNNFGEVIEAINTLCENGYTIEMSETGKLINLFGVKTGKMSFKNGYELSQFALDNNLIAR